MMAMRLFLLAVVLVAAVGAAGADTTPPSTIAGFPAIEAVSGTVVSVTSQLNEPGVLYAVVLPRGATPPSSTETRARTGSGGTPAAASGVKDVLFPYTTVQLDIFGLAPTTDYDLYIVAEDDEAISNVQATPTKLEFSTTDDVDTAAPVWDGGYPTAQSITSSSVTVAVSMDEPGTAFYAVILQGAPAPSSVELRDNSVNPAWLRASGQVAVGQASTEVTQLVEGLEAETVYSLYVVAQDAQPVPFLQDTPYGVGFATPAPADTVAPSFPMFFPRAGTITDTEVAIEVALSEPGTAHVLVQLSGDPFPTTAQVMAGSGNDGATVVASGSVALPIAEFPSSFNAQSLLPDTHYDVYVAGRDSAGNSMIVPAMVLVQTLPDISAPAWVAPYPRLVAVTDSSAKLDVQLNEPGHVFWLVLPAAEPVPTASEVINNSLGAQVVVAAGSFAVALEQSTESVTPTGLPAASSLVLYAVARDDQEPTPNPQDSATALAFDTLPDTSPPTFAVGFPIVSSVTDSLLMVDARLSEPGTVMAIALAAGSAAPTAEELLAVGTASPMLDPALLLAAKTTAVTTAGITTRTTLDKLPHNTALDVYVIAQDDESPANAQAAVTKLQATTLPDATAPLYSAGYPQVTGVTDSAADLRLSATEPATVKYIVQRQSVPDPSVAQLYAGQDGSGTAALLAGSITIAEAGAEAPVEALVGLPHTTALAVFTVAEDTHLPVHNVQSTATELQFTTLPDATPPTVVATYLVPPSISDSGMVVEAQLNEDGTLYAVAVPAGSSAPTAAEVAAGLAAGGVPPLAAASTTVTDAAPTGSLALSGLPHASSIDVYLVAADDHLPTPNLQVTPMAMPPVDTLPDATPPSFAAGFPTLTTVTDSTAVVELQLSEPGTVFVLVLPTAQAAAAAAVATPQQVAAGIASADGSIVAAVTDSRTVSAAGATVSLQLSGLEHDRDYTLWVAAQDASAALNLQHNTLVMPAFTTLPDETPPQFAATYPKLLDVTDSSIIVHVRATEACVLSYIAAPTTAFPGIATVQNVVDGTIPGASLTAAGSVALLGPNDARNISLSGMAHYTLHMVIFVLTDSAGNQEDNPLATLFVTLPDATPPSFVAGWPSVSHATDTSLTCAIQLTEPGTVYAVAIEIPVGSTIDDIAVPLPSQITAGVTSSGAAPGAAASVQVAAAMTTVEFTMPGLPHDAAMAVFVVAQDAATPTANLMEQAQVVLGSTLPDATPPAFVDGHPAVSAVADSSFTLLVAMNEPGTAFAVVLEAAAGVVPSIWDIVSGMGGNPAQAWSGQVAVAAAGQSHGTAVAGLADTTEYAVYIVAEDAASPTPNRQVAVTKLTVTTGADVTPPALVGDSVAVTALTDMSMNIELALEESGTIYVAVVATASLPSDGSLPDAATVQSGSVLNAVFHTSIITAVAKELVVVEVPPVLAASTEYTIFIIADDMAQPSNLMANVFATAVTTLADATAPQFRLVELSPGTPVPSPILVPDSITDSAATVLVALDEPGVVYALAVPQSGFVPSLAQVLGEAGAAAVDDGVRATALVTAPDTAVALALAGLAHTTTWNVFVVATDDHSPTANAQSALTTLAFMTLQDITAPAFALGYPKVAQVTDSGVDLQVALSEAARVAFVLTPTIMPVLPTPQQLWDIAEDPTAQPVRGVLWVEGLDEAQNILVATREFRKLAHFHRYYLYLHARDTRLPTANGQASVKEIMFVTLPDATPPGWAPAAVDGASNPRIASVTDSAVDVEVLLTELATLFVMVVPATSVPGTSTDFSALEVMAAVTTNALPGSGEQLAATLQGDVLDTETPAHLVLQGLQPEVDYLVGLVAQDLHVPPNVQPSPVLWLAATTLPDATPPTWGAALPFVHSVADRSAAVTLQLSEPGTVTVLVLSSVQAALLLGPAPAPSAVLAVGETTNHAIYSIMESHWQPAVAVPAAGEAVEVSLQDLAPMEDYRVLLIARDDHSPVPNQQLVVTILALTTQADTVAPSFEAGFPRVASTTAHSVVAEVSASERASAYAVVREPGATVAALEVVADPHAHTELAGNGHLAPSDVYVQWLAPETDYEMHIVLVDHAHTPNVQLATTVLSFRTLEDVDAPQFLTAPFVHNVTDSGFHITLALDEPGTVLVLVTLSQPNTPLPSVAQVAAAAAQGSSFVASELRAAVGTMTIDQPAVDSTLALEGLEAGREYVVSLVAQDEWQPDAVNRQALAHRLLVTTVADTRAPENLQGFPAVSVVTSSSVTVDLALDEPGRFHIVVVEAGAGAPPPTVATLVTGAAGLTQVVEATGLGVDSAVLTSNLKPDTEYIIYMAATDTQQPPNAQALLTTLAFRTLPADALALPWLASSFPALSGVGDTWLLFEVVTTAPARIVYAVHEAGVGISAGVVSAATVLASPSGTALTKQSKVLYVAVKHLKPSTTYGVHIVVTSPGSDDTVQLHGNSVSLSTTTLASAPPAFEPGFPAIATLSASSATFDVRLTEPGDVWLVVVPAQPQAARRLAGVTWTPKSIVAPPALVADAVAWSGQVLLPDARDTKQLVASGLLPSTAYDAWLVAADLSTPRTLQDVATLLPFQTPAAPAHKPPALTIIDSQPGYTLLRVQLQDASSPDVVAAVLAAGSNFKLVVSMVESVVPTCTVPVLDDSLVTGAQPLNMNTVAESGIVAVAAANVTLRLETGAMVTAIACWPTATSTVQQPVDVRAPSSSAVANTDTPTTTTDDGAKQSKLWILAIILPALVCCVALIAGVCCCARSRGWRKQRADTKYVVEPTASGTFDAAGAEEDGNDLDEAEFLDVGSPLLLEQRRAGQARRGRHGGRRGRRHRKKRREGSRSHGVDDDDDAVAEGDREVQLDEVDESGPSSTNAGAYIPHEERESMPGSIATPSPEHARSRLGRRARSLRGSGMPRTPNAAKALTTRRSLSNTHASARDVRLQEIEEEAEAADAQSEASGGGGSGGVETLEQELQREYSDDSSADDDAGSGSSDGPDPPRVRKGPPGRTPAAVPQTMYNSRRRRQQTITQSSTHQATTRVLQRAEPLVQASSPQHGAGSLSSTLRSAGSVDSPSSEADGSPAPGDDGAAAAATTVTRQLRTHKTSLVAAGSSWPPSGHRGTAGEQVPSGLHHSQHSPVTSSIMEASLFGNARVLGRRGDGSVIRGLPRNLASMEPLPSPVESPVSKPSKWSEASASAAAADAASSAAAALSSTTSTGDATADNAGDSEVSFEGRKYHEHANSGVMDQSSASSGAASPLQDLSTLDIAGLAGGDTAATAGNRDVDAVPAQLDLSTLDIAGVAETAITETLQLDAGPAQLQAAPTSMAELPTPPQPLARPAQHHTHTPVGTVGGTPRSDASSAMLSPVGDFEAMLKRYGAALSPDVMASPGSAAALTPLQRKLIVQRMQVHRGGGTGAHAGAGTPRSDWSSPASSGGMTGFMSAAQLLQRVMASPDGLERSSSSSQAVDDASAGAAGGAAGSSGSGSGSNGSKRAHTKSMQRLIDHILPLTPTTAAEFVASVATPESVITSPLVRAPGVPRAAVPSRARHRSRAGAPFGLDDTDPTSPLVSPKTEHAILQAIDTSPLLSPATGRMVLSSSLRQSAGGGGRVLSSTSHNASRVKVDKAGGKHMVRRKVTSLSATGDATAAATENQPS